MAKDAKTLCEELLNLDYDQFSAIGERLMSVLEREILYDDEPWHKKAWRILTDYLAHPAEMEDALVTLSGWSMESLLAMANADKADDKEGKNE